MERGVRCHINELKFLIADYDKFSSGIFDYGTFLDLIRPLNMVEKAPIIPILENPPLMNR